VVIVCNEGQIEEWRRGSRRRCDSEVKEGEKGIICIFSLGDSPEVRTPENDIE